jgi:hypothetical protein
MMPDATPLQAEAFWRKLEARARAVHDGRLTLREVELVVRGGQLVTVRAEEPQERLTWNEGRDR